MIRELSAHRQASGSMGMGPCEYRTVSKDGRIVCTKIAQGDRQVSPSVCRACPFKAVNCAHLRFSLRQSCSSPLIVRYNGRTEIWDDDPPQLSFETAACVARVIPIEHPRSCVGCPLRQNLQPVVEEAAKGQPAARGVGKILPFPLREPCVAAG